MRVCKQGCDIKMFCFSCANHASTKLRKVLSWKTRQVYFIYPFPRRLKLEKSLETFCVYFFFARAVILSEKNSYFGKHLFCKTKTDSQPIQSNSSAIEPNRTPIVRLLNSIEHNLIHNKILPIEHNRTFDYRTIGIIERSINGRRIAW